MHLEKRLLIFVLCLICFSTSCYLTRKSEGGGQTKIQPRFINTSDIALPEGYKIEAVAMNLTFPSGVTFDENGALYVIEAGYSYGEVWTAPQLLRIDTNGKTTIIAKGAKNGPWTGVAYFDNAFYIAEGGEAEGGKILRVEKDGKVSTIVDHLPGMGDHHTNGPVIKDGYIYFGQGTATNSGIVGPDNKDFGWLMRHKDFHDIPCRDVTLTGQNYKSENVLTDAAGDTALTGAYSPYNISTSPGQVIKGAIPCNGAILRVPLKGGEIELVAWGLRNPFGLRFSPTGMLYVTENGFDERGSRPVWGAADVLWEITNGTWYGWPDNSEGKPIKNDEEFKSPNSHYVKNLLQQQPQDPPKPKAIFGVHSSSDGFDFSVSDKFGFKDQAFVTQFGDMSPTAGKVIRPVGFKVVRTDVNTGIIEDFAVNKGKRNGPASWIKSGGLERPVDAKFSPSGDALYIVDFGIVKMNKKGAQPQQQTGVLWKITKL
jgi:glucose/arabinose dehydrogenase